VGVVQLIKDYLTLTTCDVKMYKQRKMNNIPTPSMSDLTNLL